MCLSDQDQTQDWLLWTRLIVICGHFLNRAKDIWEILKSRVELQCFRQSLKEKKALELVSNNIDYPTMKNSGLGVCASFTQKAGPLAPSLFYQVCAKPVIPNSKNPSRCELCLRKSPGIRCGRSALGNLLPFTLPATIVINWDKEGLPFSLFRTFIIYWNGSEDGTEQPSFIPVMSHFSFGRSQKD